jgi:hypothetical protein
VKRAGELDSNRDARGPEDGLSQLFAPEPISHLSVEIKGSNQLGAVFMHKENGQTVETSVEARAGFLDRPTLVVLIVSTALLIGLFAVIYVGFFGR